MTIRAELTGDQHATALGITATGPAPVTRLCRALIAEGHDPASRLEAYRGTTLCLSLSNLAEGAALTVKSSSSGRPILSLDRATAPHVQEIDGGGVSAPEIKNSERTSLQHGGAA
jgi:hypothetical protein